MPYTLLTDTVGYTSDFSFTQSFVIIKVLRILATVHCRTFYAIVTVLNLGYQLE